jgi:hypothetical protein
VLYVIAGVAVAIVPLAGLGAMLGVIASSVVLLPIALVVLLALLFVYVCYGVVLVGVRGAVAARKKVEAAPLTSKEETTWTAQRP